MGEEGNSSSWLEQMAGTVKCLICAETFSNNLLLPCGHTFCLKCLEEHRKVSKPRGKSFICPVCRKEFIIPKGGLPALPKNYSVQQLIDAHHQQREDKDTMRCEICDSDKQTTSVLYCLQCDQNLCVDCEKMHKKMKGCSHHHAVPVSKKEQLKEFPDDSQCAKHPDFRVDLVCLECNSLICWKCKCLEHQLHNSNDIGDMADRCKEQLRSHIKESENKMSVFCKLSVDLKDKETQQHEILEKEKNSIAKISAELIRAIVTREDALLKQVTTVAQKNLKRLQPHRERIEKQMDELKQHTADMKQLCDNGKPLELFRRSTELYAKTAEFLSLEITSTEVSLSCLPESEIRKQLLAEKVDVQRQLSGRAFTPRSGRDSSSPEATAPQLERSTYEVPSDAILTVLPQNQEALLSRKSSYGANVNVSPANNIRPQVSTRPHSFTSVSDLKETEKRSVSSTKELAICVEGESESTKDILMSMKMSSQSHFMGVVKIREKEVGMAACGVTVLRQEVYIIQDGYPEIQIYDLTNFSFRSKINIEGLVHVDDLASCESYNCIYAVDWTEQTIHRVEVEGDDKIVTKWHTAKEFGGISRSYDSNVILAGFLTGILMEYSTKGDLIREILLKPDIQEDIHPWHALKLPSGEFVISHGNGTVGQHRVCLVDVVGNVINSFGGSKGSGTDKLFGPYHMALARNGDVFVADCNNLRVVRLNDKLKYEEEIRVNMLRPRRLCFEPTSNKLLVAHNDMTDGNKFSDGAIVIPKS